MIRGASAQLFKRDMFFLISGWMLLVVESSVFEDCNDIFKIVSKDTLWSSETFRGNATSASGCILRKVNRLDFWSDQWWHRPFVWYLFICNLFEKGMLTYHCFLSWSYLEKQNQEQSIISKQEKSENTNCVNHFLVKRWWDKWYLSPGKSEWLCFSRLYAFSLAGRSER